MSRRAHCNAPNENDAGFRLKTVKRDQFLHINPGSGQERWYDPDSKPTRGSARPFDPKIDT